MASQGIFLNTRDFGLGASPPDSGNRIFVIGPSLGTMTAGLSEPLTSTKAEDFRTAFGVTKLSEYCGFLVTTTGCAVTAIGFDAQTASANANYFSTRTGNNAALAATQLSVTFSAPPMDDLNVIVRFLTGGVTGVAGITYDLSLDGGVTFGIVRALGTGLTIPLLPYAQSMVFATAVTIAAGTWQVGCCHSPVGSTNAIAAAALALTLRTSSDALLLASNEINATVSSIATLVLAGESKNKNMDLITEVRDVKRDGSETVSTWAAAAIGQATATVSRVWSPNPGHYIMPAGGYSDSPAQRRPLSLYLAKAYLTNEVHVDPARLSTGRSSVLNSFSGLTAPSPSLLKPPGAVGNPDYLHDEEGTPLFDDLRISSASKQLGPNEFYFYNARLASTPGSDYDLVQFSRLMHKARRTAYAGLVVYRHQEVFVDAVTGHIFESEAKSIDSRMTQLLVDALVSTGNCSDVRYTCATDDNILSTKELNGSIDITPRGYLKKISVAIGLINPAVSAV